jgi:hypothetical protein
MTSASHQAGETPESDSADSIMRLAAAVYADTHAASISWFQTSAANRRIVASRALPTAV